MGDFRPNISLAASIKKTTPASRRRKNSPRDGVFSARSNTCRSRSCAPRAAPRAPRRCSVGRRPAAARAGPRPALRGGRARSAARRTRDRDRRGSAGHEQTNSGIQIGERAESGDGRWRDQPKRSCWKRGLISRELPEGRSCVDRPSSPPFWRGDNWYNPPDSKGRSARPVAKKAGLSPDRAFH